MNDQLFSLDALQIERGILHCYHAQTTSLPKLYDGKAKPYKHTRACYYFFSWLLRDAPAQRLEPIAKRVKEALGLDSRTAEARTIANLMIRYRTELGTFGWESVREVFIDRLEGSRRSLKGHEREIVIRTALAAGVAKYYERKHSYGKFEDAVVLSRQLKIERESYDGAIELYRDGKVAALILVPVKTRETEGGGHAQLFSRDIIPAIQAARREAQSYVISVIVAQRWSEADQKYVEKLSDLALFVKVSPNDFDELPEALGAKLCLFLEAVLDGSLSPKKLDSAVRR